MLADAYLTGNKPLRCASLLLPDNRMHSRQSSTLLSGVYHHTYVGSVPTAHVKVSFGARKAKVCRGQSGSDCFPLARRFACIIAVYAWSLSGWSLRTFGRGMLAQRECLP